MPAHVLQWGRTLSSAEVPYTVRSDAGWKELQWGRTLSSAEVHDRILAKIPLLKRFNGAALFQVRK